MTTENIQSPSTLTFRQQCWPFASTHTVKSRTTTYVVDRHLFVPEEPIYVIEFEMNATMSTHSNLFKMIGVTVISGDGINSVGDNCVDGDNRVDGGGNINNEKEVLAIHKTLHSKQEYIESHGGKIIDIYLISN